MTDFCNNNKTQPIRISAFSYGNSGSHQLYGRIVTSVREIEMGLTELELRNKRGKKMGVLRVDYFKVDMKPSLLKYMRAGWSLNMSIAIDFTLSNGAITENRSKHRQDLKRQGDMNDYEKAIYEVAGVLQKFVHDKKFTMYGFGGIPWYLTDGEKNTNFDNNE